MADEDLDLDVEQKGSKKTKLIVIILIVVVFVWASTLAMLLRDFSGETGFAFSGAPANKLGYALDVIGAVSLALGLAWLCWGLVSAI